MGLKVAREGRRVQGVSGAPVTGGVCVNCVHATTCRLSSSRTEPVWDCEEYRASGGPDAVAVKLNGGPPADYARARRLGLCVDCVHRECCTLPKPEGGVWHCEEYS